MSEVNQSQLQNLLQRLDVSGELRPEEARELLALEEPGQVQLLLETADHVRAREVGDGVHIRGLIEFSNHCRKNCCYCGLRRDNTHLERYRLSPDDIVDLAVRVNALGIRTAVLQSGEDVWYSPETIADIVRRIKASTDMAVTLSVGEREREDYALWRQAGADRYLLRHETANPRLYARMHTGTTLEHRMRCVDELRDLGYQIGIGFMAGLPGQTLLDLVADIMYVQRIQPDMLGIGPFIPNPDTPLGGEPGGTLGLALKCVALGRLVTRNALIPATTAVGTIDEWGREKALQAGANVVMPNYTPRGSRELYSIYPNKRCVGEDPLTCLGCLKARIIGIGRSIATDRGDSYKTTRGASAALGAN